MVQKFTFFFSPLCGQHRASDNWSHFKQYPWAMYAQTIYYWWAYCMLATNEVYSRESQYVDQYVMVHSKFKWDVYSVFQQQRGKNMNDYSITILYLRSLKPVTSIDYLGHCAVSPRGKTMYALNFINGDYTLCISKDMVLKLLKGWLE